MFEIENAVKNLDIEDGFKHLLSACISAEIFNLKKAYNPEIKITKYTQAEDNRVWCEVSLVINSKDIVLAQCRPFIDKGVSMSASIDSVFMRKTYFLYTV